MSAGWKFINTEELHFFAVVRLKITAKVISVFYFYKLNLKWMEVYKLWGKYKTLHLETICDPGAQKTHVAGVYL